tara:strand:- start:5688 stop:6659 length:972 start_codon:yes stop_codon:yes gene_type:complete
MPEVNPSNFFCLDLPNTDAAVALSSGGHIVLRNLEKLTGVTINLRGLQLEMTGEQSQLERASSIVELTRYIWENGQSVSEIDLISAMKSLDKGLSSSHAALGDKVLARSQSGYPLWPRTLGQKKLVEAIEQNDLTFAIGPAGTGKTFLATIVASKMLNQRLINKIILTRPAVEAGERLGFLPGDLQQKVDPYLRPLYDCFHNIYGLEKTNNLIDKGIIEIAPLAFMRGRTLENAFIILDEAQNTSTAQMKMFLTRFGEKSKMVINGDITQIDLPNGESSGLEEATKILQFIPGIATCHLSSEDVVRHKIVQKVIDAYTNFCEE